MLLGSVLCEKVESIEIFARSFIKNIKSNDIFAIYGDLGAGKTTFVRSVIKTVCKEKIPSPTYSLVQIYETQIGEIWHCDFYRLKNIQQIIELGIEDAISRVIMFIEWPELIEKILPKETLNIEIKITNNECRKISFFGIEYWKKRLFL